MDKLFLSALNMSLTGAFVIAAIMLVRLPLKKAPKMISYCFWAVAGFRLAVPFTFEGVFSLIPFKSSPIPADIGFQAVPRIDSGTSTVDNAVSRILPAATPYYSANPLQIWISIGSYLWLAGIAVMLIYSIVSIALMKQRLRSAVNAGDNIFEAENLKTPLVMGLFRPKIYIPTGLTDEERRFILLHERTHIRRHDHAVKMFAFLLLCIHWFNPLAWVAFLLMCADMEMSCDERVMKELGSEIKHHYSLTLVRMSASRRIFNYSPLAFSEGGMKERVKNVLNFKKSSRRIVLAAVILVVVLTVGFAVNSSAKSPDTSEDAALTCLTDPDATSAPAITPSALVTPETTVSETVAAIDTSNWQSVVKSKFGIDISLPDGWTITGASNPSFTDPLFTRLSFEMGGSMTAEEFGTLVFDAIKAVSINGNTDVNDGTALETFFDAKTGKGFPTWEFALSENSMNHYIARVHWSDEILYVSIAQSESPAS
jgi:beta-lactamase regulating signal transducer with metallopeptidase domain